MLRRDVDSINSYAKKGSKVIFESHSTKLVNTLGERLPVDAIITEDCDGYGLAVFDKGYAIACFGINYCPICGKKLNRNNCSHKYDKKFEKCNGEWVAICTNCGEVVK